MTAARLPVFIMYRLSAALLVSIAVGCTDPGDLGGMQDDESRSNPRSMSTEEIPIEERVPGTDKYHTGAKIRARLGEALFEVPAEEWGSADRPMRQGDEVVLLGLSWYWVGGELRGARPAESHESYGRGIPVWVKRDFRKIPYGSDPPDRFLTSIKGRSQWKGPFVNSQLNLIEYQLDKADGSRAYVYTMTDLDPDGTYPVLRCIGGELCMLNGRLDKDFSYNYFLPKEHVEAWRRIHPAIRAKINSLRLSTGPEAARVIYECESGVEIRANYSSQNEALVEYEGEVLRMTSAVSASGVRYVGEGLEWWTQGAGIGSEGTMFRHDDGGTGESIESCVAISG